MTGKRKKNVSIGETFPRLSAASVEDYQTSLDRIALYIGTSLGAEACSIFLEREPGKYTLEASTEPALARYSRERQSVYYQSGEGLTGWVAKHAQRLRVADMRNATEMRGIASDLEWKAKVAERARSEKGAFLAVPVVVNSYVLGVIQVTGRSKAFADNEEERLVEFANELAKQLTMWPHVLRSLPGSAKESGRTEKGAAGAQDRGAHTGKPRVFITHVQSDHLKANRLASELRKTGAWVWLDEWELRAGDSLRERIDQSLAASAYLLVLLSPDSIRSRWIRKEWSAAFEKELNARAITVIPTLVADCQVPPDLDSRQIVDLRGDFDAAVQRFALEFASVPQLDLQAMNEAQLTALVKDILTALGFHEVSVCHGTLERGYDIRAKLRPADPFATEDEQWFVEVKSYKSGRADLKTITQMFDLISFWPHEAKGLIVTNGQLTSAARSWLDSTVQRVGRHVRVIDGTDLRELLLRHPQIAQRFGK